MKPMLNLTTGQMFDFSPQPRPLDVAPAHYIDYHPDETRRQVDAMLQVIQKSSGEFDGKAWLDRVKAFAKDSPHEVLFTIDSYAPIS
jgi:hypothetical protein